MPAIPSFKSWRVIIKCSKNNGIIIRRQREEGGQLNKMKIRKVV